MILAGAFLLLLAFILIFFSEPEPWHPNIRLTFSRFSTSSSLSNMQAEFLVTGLPSGEGVTFLMDTLNRKEGTNWKRCDLELGPYDVQVVPQITPRHYRLFAFVPVETTNVPSQIILEVKRSPKGLARLWHDLRERWEEFRGRSVFTTGTGIFITNETIIAEPVR